MEEKGLCKDKTLDSKGEILITGERRLTEKKKRINPRYRKSNAKIYG